MLPRCVRFTITVLGLVLISTMGLSAGEITKGQIAHIKLSGSLDETPVSVDPLLGGGENFKSKIDRILKVKDDKNVAALYIHIDTLNVGFAKMEELRQAIAAVRKSGKKTYAYLEAGESKDYLVAAECDVVALPEPGWLMVVGMQAEVTFFKELLDKLGIHADFLQMGVFKSAAEPFTRSKMSPEAKSQLKLVLDDLFLNGMVNTISRSRSKGDRKISPDDARKLIDEGPFTAKAALKKGLVDQIAYPDDFENFIKKDIGNTNATIVRDYGAEKSKEIDLSNPFALLKLLAPPKASDGGRPDRIAIIYAVGPIVTGKGGQSLFGGSVVGSTAMIEAIREAEKDSRVKAIVLRVDSPGGSALASDLIWNELKKCKKPIIASMSDVAASGGYYISMGAKKIFAEPTTITGSIGVVGGKLALAGLFEKVGINTEIISNGANAGILSSTEPFSKSQRAAMEALMKEIYEQFRNKAIEGRNAAGQKFTPEDMLKLAEGRVWTGRQALDNGLVDALGSLQDAIAEAKVQGGLKKETEVDYLILPKPRTFIEALFDKGSDASLSSVVSPADLARLAHLPELAQHLGTIDALLQMRSEPVWVMMPAGLKIR